MHSHIKKILFTGVVPAYRCRRSTSAAVHQYLSYSQWHFQTNSMGLVLRKPQVLLALLPCKHHLFNTTICIYQLSPLFFHRDFHSITTQTSPLLHRLVPVHSCAQANEFPIVSFRLPALWLSVDFLVLLYPYSIEEGICPSRCSLCLCHIVEYRCHIQ